MMNARNSLLIVLLCLVLTVLSAELAARFSVLPDIYTVDEVRRNHYFRRGWPEYLSVERQNDHRIIIISNSQGFGREVDESAIYPTLLEHRLNREQFEGFTDWKVENWSLPGGNFPEFMVMAAKAAAVQARYVIVSFYLLNLKPSFLDRDISFFLNDSARFLTEKEVYYNLPKSFRKRHVSWESIVGFAATDTFAFLRAKEYLLEKFLKGGPIQGKKKSAAVFFTFGDFSLWEGWFYNEKLRRPLAYRKTNFASLKPAALYYHRASLQFIRELDQTYAKTNKKLILASMPLCKRVLMSTEPQRRFNADIEQMSKDLHLNYTDFSFSVPDTEFVLFTHLNAQGHVLYADLLQEKLIEMQHRSIEHDREAKNDLVRGDDDVIQ